MKEDAPVAESCAPSLHLSEAAPKSTFLELGLAQESGPRPRCWADRRTRRSKPLPLRRTAQSSRRTPSRCRSRSGPPTLIF